MPGGQLGGAAAGTAQRLCPPRAAHNARHVTTLLGIRPRRIVIRLQADDAIQGGVLRHKCWSQLGALMPPCACPRPLPTATPPCPTHLAAGVRHAEHIVLAKVAVGRQDDDLSDRSRKEDWREQVRGVHAACREAAAAKWCCQSYLEHESQTAQELLQSVGIGGLGAGGAVAGARWSKGGVGELRANRGTPQSTCPLHLLSHPQPWIHPHTHTHSPYRPAGCRAAAGTTRAPAPPCCPSRAGTLAHPRPPPRRWAPVGQWGSVGGGVAGAEGDVFRSMVRVTAHGTQP